MSKVLPSTATLILSAIAGVLVAFIQSNIIVLEAGWNEGATVGLTILAVWGISPITGAAFRALLHLTNGEATIIATLLATAQIVLTQVHLSSAWHGVLAGVIAFAGGLGFAPTLTTIDVERLKKAGLIITMIVASAVLPLLL